MTLGKTKGTIASVGYMLFTLRNIFYQSMFRKKLTKSRKKLIARLYLNPGKRARGRIIEVNSYFPTKNSSLTTSISSSVIVCPMPG